MNNNSLSGQVALVTGASRGIGRAIALGLAEDGATVVVAYGSSQAQAEELVAEIRAIGASCVLMQAELADRQAAVNLVEQTVNELGRIDILVNNGGITKDGLAMRMSDEDWQSVIDIDLSASFYTSRTALKTMLKQRSGRIINISSVVGVMGNAGQANYSAAKAGLIGLTKSLAREVGSRSITVNAVAPGFIETDMTAGLSQDLKTQVTGNIPLARLGTVQEVAAAVRFLASPNASYITAHVLHVDGGLAA